MFSCLQILEVFFSSIRRHTMWPRDWSSDVCSSDLDGGKTKPPKRGKASRLRLQGLLGPSPRHPHALRFRMQRVYRSPASGTSWLRFLHRCGGERNVINPCGTLNPMPLLIASVTQQADLHFLNVFAGRPGSLDLAPRLGAMNIGSDNRGTVLCS